MLTAGVGDNRLFQKPAASLPPAPGSRTRRAVILPGAAGTRYGPGCDKVMKQSVSRSLWVGTEGSRIRVRLEMDKRRTFTCHRFHFVFVEKRMKQSRGKLRDLSLFHRMKRNG